MEKIRKSGILQSVAIVAACMAVYIVIGKVIGIAMNEMHIVM